MTIREKVARAIAPYAFNDERGTGGPGRVRTAQVIAIENAYNSADAALSALPVTVEQMEQIARGEAGVISEKSLRCDICKEPLTAYCQRCADI